MAGIYLIKVELADGQQLIQKMTVLKDQAILNNENDQAIAEQTISEQRVDQTESDVDAAVEDDFIKGGIDFNTENLIIGEQGETIELQVPVNIDLNNLKSSKISKYKPTTIKANQNRVLRPFRFVLPYYLTHKITYKLYSKELLNY